MRNLEVGFHVPNSFVIEHMLKQECPKVCHLSQKCVMSSERKVCLSLTGVEISISPKFF